MKKRRSSYLSSFRLLDLAQYESNRPLPKHHWASPSVSRDKKKSFNCCKTRFLPYRIE